MGFVVGVVTISINVFLDSFPSFLVGSLGHLEQRSVLSDLASSV